MQWYAWGNYPTFLFKGPQLVQFNWNWSSALYGSNATKITFTRILFFLHVDMVNESKWLLKWLLIINETTSTAELHIFWQLWIQHPQRNVGKPGDVCCRKGKTHRHEKDTQRRTGNPTNITHSLYDQNQNVNSFRTQDCKNTKDDSVLSKIMENFIFFSIIQKDKISCILCLFDVEWNVSFLF